MTLAKDNQACEPESPISSRRALGTAICGVAAMVGVPLAASAHDKSGLCSRCASIIRSYYAAWETRDWRPFEILLADDFTFTSANNDDHISKSAFKVRCWESQIDFIKRFVLERMIGSGNEAFVQYVCHTKNGNAFRNVEYVRLRRDKLEAIECYFGAQSSFASAVGAISPAALP
jgi:hypothetical protein